MVTIQSKRHFVRLDFLLLLIGVSCISYAAIHLLDWYTHTQGTATPPNPYQVVTTSSATPDEKPVPSGATYNVPADQPKKMLIPSINIDGFIERVGKNQHKEIGTPSNVNYAGWYIESVRPGDKGLSIIDGHVSSRYGSALFAKLGNLQKGDAITVQFGDNSLRHFEVTDKRELPKDQAGLFLLKKQDNIDQQLNLITCGGLFDKNSLQYNNRVVVVAKRVN